MPRENFVYINDQAQITKFSRELALGVCDVIACGFSVKQACEKHPKFPAPQTFRLWLAGRRIDEDDHEWLREEYTAAEIARADALIDECLDIADETENDWIEEEHKDGSTHFKANTEVISRSKLRIDTRAWAASRVNPEKYGAKAIVTIKVKKLNPTERDARILELLNKCAIPLAAPEKLHENLPAPVGVNTDDE